MEGFELLGTPADETRLLVHRGRGFSIPIPGHPVLAASIPPAPPTYDVIVTLTDLAVEIGVRIDRMPLGPEPVALAAALTQAYATSRAADLRRVGGLRGRLLGDGFDGGANTIYARRDAGPAPQMEHVQVVVHEEDDATYAVYLTTRYAAADVDVVRWANLRTAMAGTQRWDAGDPRTEPPRLWPEASAFAEPGARLLLSPSAHAEAQRKSAELGQLTEAQAAALVDALILDRHQRRAADPRPAPAHARDLLPPDRGVRSDPGLRGHPPQHPGSAHDPRPAGVVLARHLGPRPPSRSGQDGELTRPSAQTNSLSALLKMTAPHRRFSLPMTRSAVSKTVPASVFFQLSS